MYLRIISYTERIISEVLNINPISLVVVDVGAALVYLQLNPKIENNKYVENEFVILEPPKGKHTMENILA